MNLERLEPSERDLIGQCLRASATGPFFPDWEFSTLFGLERIELCAIADVWPGVGNRELTELAINNSLNNLVGYPHGCDGIWSQWISAKRVAEASVETSRCATSELFRCPQVILVYGRLAV